LPPAPLPPHPWVLHSTPLLGSLTDRWIDVQVQSTNRFGSRLLGAEVAPGAGVPRHWIVLPRLSLEWFAYRGMFRTDGLSPILLAQRFRAHAPAVIHVHYGPPAAQLCRFAEALGRPLVTSFYGYDASLARYRETWIWKRRYARLFQRGSAFVVEGPAMASRLAGLGCPEHKIHVVRLPADSVGLENLTRRPADRFTVAVAGRFTEKKGFDTAIAAFARAFDQQADAQLLMIGGGDLEHYYRSLAAQHGIAHRVEWAGRLPFQEFMRRVASAHVALYPSRTASDGDSEGGAPVTLIESQWLGVPSLVSRHADLPFVAAPEGAVVLPEEDISAWADALRSAAEEPSRLARMGAAARAFARRYHTPSANAEAREMIYQALS
jgi:colanic acid/amylovoran biosynthesis glycosyltransferase